MSDLDQLAADFLAAEQRVMPAMAKVVADFAENVERDAKANIRALIAEVYLPHYPDAITSEVDGLSAEIGPESGKPQGGMSVEFGSSLTGPKPHLFPASEANEPKLYNDLSKAAGDFL